MSMYQIEDFVEAAVRAVAQSDFSILQKRNFIHTLFEMERCGDCSFTNLRNIKEMADCLYSFGFSEDALEKLKEPIDETSTYYDDESDLYYIDSGSNAWKSLVKMGIIAGDGAVPVELLPFEDVLAGVKTLLGEMDSYLRQGFDGLAIMTGVADEDDDFDEDDDPHGDSDTYDLCGSSVKFAEISEVDSDSNLVLHGYEASCSITMWGHEALLELQALLPEPVKPALGSYSEEAALHAAETARHLSQTMPREAFQQISANISQYLTGMNALPTYLSVVTQMAGYSGTDAKLEKIKCVVQTLARGVKNDYYFRITTPDSPSFELHTGEVSEILLES